MTANKSPKQLADEWPTIRRENGLIEIMCPDYGIGHPSQKLTKKLSDEKYYYAPHGCDGCCGTATFYLAEMYHAGELK